MAEHGPEIDPSGWALPWTGGCRCGAVRFEVTAPPVIAVACHCKGCRRMTGGPYSLGLMVPEAGFRLTKGETVRAGLGAAPGALTDGAPEGAGIDHRACGVCASWMFTHIPFVAGLVNLRPTMLDHDEWVVPLVETCRDEALPGVASGARHAFGGFPEMDAWPGLMAEYATTGARPPAAR